MASDVFVANHFIEEVIDDLLHSSDEDITQLFNDLSAYIDDQNVSDAMPSHISQHLEPQTNRQFATIEDKPADGEPNKQEPPKKKPKKAKKAEQPSGKQLRFLYRLFNRRVIDKNNADNEIDDSVQSLDFIRMTRSRAKNNSSVKPNQTSEQSCATEASLQSNGSVSVGQSATEGDTECVFCEFMKRPNREPLPKVSCVHNGTHFKPVIRVRKLSASDLAQVKVKLAPNGLKNKQRSSREKQRNAQTANQSQKRDTPCQMTRPVASIPSRPIIKNINPMSLRSQSSITISNSKLSNQPNSAKDVDTVYKVSPIIEFVDFRSCPKPTIRSKASSRYLKSIFKKRKRESYLREVVVGCAPNVKVTLGPIKQIN